MFERAHHRNVALVLQSLEPQVLQEYKCYFGGGTAMALRYGEYRESVDIDFMVSDAAGYRELRQRLGAAAGLSAIVRPGLALELERPVTTDQYGIRTRVRAGSAGIKFEIVREARIVLQAPGEHDTLCAVPSLTPLDLACEKLLANADRWLDDVVFNRDLIDLAMQLESTSLLRAACVKAEEAYGRSVRESVSKAIDSLRKRQQRLDQCMAALDIRTVTKAQLWQRIRRVERVLG